MPNTSRGYPYPTLDSPNNVPADVQNLAEKINADVQTQATRLQEARTDLNEASAALSGTAGKLVRRGDNASFNIPDPSGDYEPVNSRTSNARVNAVEAASQPRGVVGRRTLSWNDGVATSAGFTATLPAGRFSSMPVAVATVQMDTTSNRNPACWVSAVNTSAVSVRARANASEITSFDVAYAVFPVTP